MPFRPSSFDFLPYVERDRVRDVVDLNRKLEGHEVNQHWNMNYWKDNANDKHKQYVQKKL